MKKLLALLLICAPLAAHAERYRVDILVFADKTGAADEAPLPLSVPNLKGAIEPYDTAELKAAGIEVLPEEQFGLANAWGHLRNSRNHQPLLRFAWVQTDPPDTKAIPIHLHWGQPFNSLATSGNGSVYPVDGTVALLGGRLLHVDTEFIWTQAGSGGDLLSYRLDEKRRVKRDELHHIDSPKLGVLAQVTRVDVAPSKKKK